MVIRKISIGPDYKSSMNYAIGQRVFKGEFVISEIRRSGDEFTVWIKNGTGELMAWKTIIGMPVVVESDLSFAE
jgi:hypothetical protein